VRVRFAPSPTGFLHIGGVRTAYFNWLFARRHGGSFVLRVDDTDAERNLAQALQPILDGFRWLGVDWDEGPEVGGPYAPYYQSQRHALYARAVERLLENGTAYRDYARPEEIQAERAESEAAKRPYAASRRWAAASEDDRRRFAAEGRSAVVRLAMPREGVCRIDDLVRGTVETAWAAEPDHVIQRADGSCLYHLASVVDDVEMAITHVIRAEEHLSNTPRQIRIFEGLGAWLPAFAHLPVVAEPGSKVKLSKRKLDKYLKNPEFADLYRRGQKIAGRLGLDLAPDLFNPVVVDFYRISGFEPEALLNYLLLLGWSLDGTTELLPRAERIARFDLAGVHRAAASFDPKKLLAFEERYFQALSVAERVERCLPYAERAGWIGSPPAPAERARIAALVEAAGERLKLAGDLLDYDEFFVADPTLVYDEAAFDQRIRNAPGAPALLAELRTELATVEPFDAVSLERLFAGFVAARGLGLGAVVHAVRVAATGKPVGFGLFDILALLGRERTLARIDRALARLRPAA
jgi:glutamyl-tRNA synthetase